MHNPLKDIHILVAEDVAPMMALTVSALYEFGCEKVYRAQEGGEAYEMFVYYKPDIVITDLMMEPVDGLQLLNKIRKDPTSPNTSVPVIIMTALGNRIHVELARDSGMTEFLAKPFNLVDLKKRLLKIIERPRPFIESEQYTGPDRRRKPNLRPNGPGRRQVDGDWRLPAPRRRGSHQPTDYKEK